MTGQRAAPTGEPRPGSTRDRSDSAGWRPPPTDPPRSATSLSSGQATWWDRSWATFDRWTPYVLLAASTVMSLLNPQQPPGAWMGTLALVGLGVVWIALGYTTAPPERRIRPAHALVYLAGLLAIAAALMARDIIFFVFAISGFLHAAPLRPLPLVFVGTGSTSLSILYFTWGGFPRETGEMMAFAAILTIQTFLIGFGVAGGEKLAELSEERRTTLAALEASMAENQALQTQLVAHAREAGISQERQRLAREIHDTIAQGLTGIVTQLEAAAQREDDPAAHHRHLDDAARLARRSLVEVRRSVQALSPGELEHARLPVVLEEHVGRVAARHALEADTQVDGVEVPMPAEVEIALLRVAQEALTNVVRHAGASRVGVTLSLLDDQVRLDVRDDGRGFVLTGAPSARCFGLTSMRQRLDEVGGTLTIESEPGAGTAISAAVPLAGRARCDG